MRNRYRHEAQPSEMLYVEISRAICASHEVGWRLGRTLCKNPTKV